MRAAHARGAHCQTGASAAVAVCRSQAPLAGRDDNVTEAVVVGSAMPQAATTSPARAAELVMIYGKTLLATRTLQAMGRGGRRRIPRVNVVELEHSLGSNFCFAPGGQVSHARCLCDTAASSLRANNLVVVAPAISLYRQRCGGGSGGTWIASAE